MSLLKTAVKVGVASSVHGRVQRRQQQRWAAQDQAAAGQAVAVQAAPVPVQQSPAPPGSGPALDAVPDIERLIELLKQLADLASVGVLTPEEFAAQKARVLG